MEVSIVIPAQNEEKTIKQFVTRLSTAFRNSEIIVVCNGCTDNTYEVTKSIKRKNVKVLNFGKIGKGGAVYEGLKIAKKPIFGFVDSDGSFNERDIKKVLKGMKNYDVSIGSKWIGKNFFSVHWPFTRKIGSRVWNLFVRVLLGLNLSDTQAGLKIFKRTAYNSIDHNFICKGFEFDIELLDKFNRKGYKIKETFIIPKAAEKTTFNFMKTPKMLFNLIKLKLNNLQIS